MPEEKYISLKPSEAVHGGGMVPEGTYDITNALFAMWDYNGTVIPAVPALAVEFKNADAQTYTQYYSAGDVKNMRPSEDGRRLVQVGSVGALNDATNCFAFMASVVSGGMSEDKIANDISILIGCTVEIRHEAGKEREIRGQKTPARVIAVIHKITKFPSEQAKAAKKATVSRANGQQGDTAAIQPKALEVLQAVLAEAGGSLDKKSITAKAFQKIASTDPDRAAVLNLLVKDEFLTSLIPSGVLYDAANGTVIYVQQ